MAGPGLARVGVFTGAGTSTALPAGVPAGDVFHHRLRELCFERAALVVGDIVDPSVLDDVAAAKVNLLARIENTRPGAGRGALASMRVTVPNEAHLLAALHLAAGGIHVTMNFDDGIERAYALLTGRARLPPAAARFGGPLRGWQGAVPADPPPLRVAARAADVRPALAGRPVLVKVHGSLGREADGVTLPGPAMTDEPDPGDLGGDRRLAFDALAAQPEVLVTGFSGADHASRTALLDRLVAGRFRWVAPHLDPAVRRLVAAVDPSQPERGRAVAALRRLVAPSASGSALPRWPGVAVPGTTVDDRLWRWADGLPAAVAAEALAWALTDAGRVDESVDILRRLARAGGGPSSAVRLAEALARRRWPGDVVAARRTLLRAGIAGRPGRRGYAVARLAESIGTGHDARELGVGRAAAVAALVAATSVGGRRAAAPVPARLRATTVEVGVLLAAIERDVPDAVASPSRRRGAGSVAGAAARLARRRLASTERHPSGRRRALLERQAIELEVVSALLRGERPAPGLPDALARLVEVFDHVADPEGRADALGTLALVALADGDLDGSRAALGAATRVRPDCVGPVGLARRLLEQHPDLLGAPVPRRPAPRRAAGARRGGLAAFVDRLPKVELHVHLEGAVRPATLACLARRNGDARVPWSAAEVRRWYRFDGYRDFVNAHVLVCDQLRRPEDLHRLVIELGADLARGNVRYAEVAISPDTYRRRGLPAPDAYAALEEGREEVAATQGIELRWCATAGTRLGPSVAVDVIESVLAHAPAAVVSVGLAGLESSVARRRFAPAFDLAAAAGLHRVVHAGEAGGSASIWQAIDDLGAERIGHGIRCLDDEVLLDRLRRDGIALEVCPSSNVRTGVVGSLRSHPLPRLVASGVPVTLNTDDPAMFGTDLCEEYARAAAACALGPDGVADLARAAVRASFLPPDAADVVVAEIDEVVADHVEWGSEEDPR